jgi:lantibiotic biosynthesis protein
MWEPIVQSSILKEKIYQCLDEIDKVLDQMDSNIQLGLMSGSTGRLIYNCYRSAQLDTSDYNQKIENDIIQSFENLKALGSGALSGGVAGVLWALHHLNKNEFIEIDDDNFKDISESLSNSLIKNSLVKNFDYLHGANGIALYLMNRSEETAHKNFNQWLESFYAIGIKKNNSIAWETLINAKEHLFGFSLGLAHGTPSIIHIMVQLLKKHQYPLAKEILDLSINHLLEQMLPRTSVFKPNKNYFPNYIASEKPFNSSRLAWCYGDLGCAMALFTAGEFLKREDLIDFSREIMWYHAENISDEQASLNHDADFCHGTVGVAHLFARFYNYTKLESFRNASEFYYAKTMDFSKYSDGLAGFKHLTENGFENNYTLLEGISGIGLSLISAISNTNPKWDSAFLLSDQAVN